MDHRQVAGVDLQYRQVRLFVRADEGCLGDAPVVQQHLDVGGVGDHVVVGQHVALALCADDDTRSKRLLAVPVGRRLATEQLLQHRVVVHLDGLFGDDPVGVDIDHRWRGGSYRVRVGNRAVADVGLADRHRCRLHQPESCA
jgi:hypothetical protein